MPTEFFYSLIYGVVIIFCVNGPADGEWISTVVAPVSALSCALSLTSGPRVNGPVGIERFSMASKT